jgi:hypothetical protein
MIKSPSIRCRLVPIRIAIARSPNVLTRVKLLRGEAQGIHLAGQSNMEGHAEIRTFDYIGKDPATAPLLKEMRNP